MWHWKVSNIPTKRASSEEKAIKVVFSQEKMHALGPLLFPNSGWAPTGECESYKLVGDSHNNDTFLDFPVPKTYGVVHHQTSLGVPVLSEGNGLNNNSVVIKKLNHNAKERNRRQKANSLFSSLRSCLPRSDQSVSNLHWYVIWICFIINTNQQ